MYILYSSTNHVVVYTDHSMKRTNHVVVCTFHGDILEIGLIMQRKRVNAN